VTAIRTVGVPREIKTAEHRVAMTPDGVRELERHGINVYVEKGAGEGASIADDDYRAAGADIVPTADDAWNQELVVKVKEPQDDEFSFHALTSPSSRICIWPPIRVWPRRCSRRARQGSPMKQCSSIRARCRCWPR
jgi:hypothetical protein